LGCWPGSVKRCCASSGLLPIKRAAATHGWAGEAFRKTAPDQVFVSPPSPAQTGHVIARQPALVAAPVPPISIRQAVEDRTDVLESTLHG
jgi:hypothetical protein